MCGICGYLGEPLDGLVEAMAGLASGVVVVDGDVERGLERAISDRGRKWAAELARQRVGSEDLSELASYFGRLRATTGAMLPTWPGSQLRVDTERCRGESARLLGEWLAGELGS